ncbi:MAG TPA: SRPBCC family protein [Nitrospira sp.]|nr:SRPBCC family protein [Nitrospira sp.]
MTSTCRSESPITSGPSAKNFNTSWRASNRSSSWMPNACTGRAEIGGKEKAWDAEIMEQMPDQRIAWKSIGGAWTAGTVTFQPLSNGSCTVTVRMEYDPQGVIDQTGDAVGLVSQRVQGDLDRSNRILNPEDRKRVPGVER